jgi:uncharacterized damage-inducible protein DinB
MTDFELRFPVGKFALPETIDAEYIAESIKVINDLPAQLRKLTQGVSDRVLDTPYRENGWTVRQVIHHIADSHMNCFIRFKLALTEDKPTIKPYEEALWAQQTDYTLPIEASLSIIEGLHARWVALLESLTEEDLQKSFIHPEYGREYKLANIVALYNWHCRHHLGHVRLVIK